MNRDPIDDVADRHMVEIGKLPVARAIQVCNLLADVTGRLAKMHPDDSKTVIRMLKEADECPKTSEKALNDPPETKQKGRKKKPEPEPVEAEFVEQPATEENLPMHTTAAPDTSGLPAAAENRCPHCGGIL